MSADTLAGARHVIELEELFDVFGVKRGNWRWLALRLASGRWPGTLVIDSLRAKKSPGRPPSRKTAVANQILVQEIAAIQCGYRRRVRQLSDAGFSAPRIAAQTELPEKQVQRILDGDDMTDEAAIKIHLKLRRRRSGDEDACRRAEHAWLMRYSRAIRSYGRPAVDS
jgi:hypothetical protein